jgi:hypothetical protein
MSISFFVAEDIPNGEFRDHGDLVVVEVMVKLAGCDQDHVQ